MPPSAQRIAGGAATDSLNYFCVEVLQTPHPIDPHLLPGTRKVFTDSRL
ncbi:MAG: hypothetical protein ABIH80_03350 [Methanobacteriota archaeon]